MNTLPASLLQLHYHNRVGGVSRVMELYRSTFAEVAGAAAVNRIICAHTNETTDNNIIDLPDADYCTFASASDFELITGSITSQLLQILDNPDLPLPAAIIGHNLTLGKNCALAAAFTRIALQKGTDVKRFRFFLCMHDFFEDGRVREMDQVRKLESAGINLRQMLYAAGAPVHYIVPATAAATITGLPLSQITVLPHCVQIDSRQQEAGDRNELLRAITNYLSISGTPLPDEQHWFCYPSRMIYRKNLPEAFLLATVILKGILFTGTTGTHCGDAELVRQLSRLSKRHGLPFFPDALTMLSPVKQLRSAEFTDLFPVMDAIITTSRAEGFGFTLFEPWVCGKPVIGRMPSGASLLEGMNAPALYTRLPIPAEWIDLESCYRVHAEAYKRSFNRPYQNLDDFSNRISIEGTIDFGMLDESQQCMLLERLCTAPEDADRLRALLLNPLSGWPGLGTLSKDNLQFVDANASAVTKWAHHAFRLSFINTLSPMHIDPTARNWHTSIEEHFSTWNNFNPNSRSTDNQISGNNL